jgi:Flp pilus assembly protein TadB
VTSPAWLSRDLGLLPSLDFYRQELELERDARSSLLSWYILPAVPGVSVTTVAIALIPGGRGVLPAVVLATLFAAIFTVTVKLSQRVARRLQREIDELRAQ